VPAITHLMLKNFRKLDSLRMNFQPATNVLIDDNECGKNSDLLTLDPVLSGSWPLVKNLALIPCLAARRIWGFNLSAPNRFAGRTHFFRTLRKFTGYILISMRATLTVEYLNIV